MVISNILPVKMKKIPEISNWSISLLFCLTSSKNKKNAALTDTMHVCVHHSMSRMCARACARRGREQGTCSTAVIYIYIYGNVSDWLK